MKHRNVQSDKTYYRPNENERHRGFSEKLNKNVKHHKGRDNNTSAQLKGYITTNSNKINKGRDISNCTGNDHTVTQHAIQTKNRFSVLSGEKQSSPDVQQPEYLFKMTLTQPPPGSQIVAMLTLSTRV